MQSGLWSRVLSHSREATQGPSQGPLGPGCSGTSALEPSAARLRRWEWGATCGSAGASHPFPAWDRSCPCDVKGA